jgi:tetratricopeptide (TPR) repeat protein
MPESKPQELITARDLYNKGKLNEALQIIEKFEEKGNLTQLEQNTCRIIKSDCLGQLGNYKDSLRIAEKAYEESKSLSIRTNSVDALLVQARGLQMLGELDKSLEKIEECEDLLKTLTGDKKEIKRREARLTRLKGNILVFKGDEREALKYQEKALVIAEEIDDKRLIGSSLNNLGERYRILGDLDHALLYGERAITHYDEFFGKANTVDLAFALGTTTRITLEMGDLEKAKNYLQRLEQLNKQEDNQLIDLFYREIYAFILKASPRARNRVKAEDLLRQIIEDDVINFESSVEALINLCDLLLTELQMTNDIDIIDEINPLITRLLDLAENQHSYWIQVEAYILKAKMALLTLDIKEARHLLTQAQFIAEKFKLNRLAIIISNEHDELLKQLSIWENLKESEAPMSDRLELARVSDYMEHMLKKHIADTPGQASEAPVLLLIIAEGGIPAFSKIFTEELSLEEHLISSFLTAFNSFSGELFSEGLDRAKFGEYTIIMMRVESFSVCYLFKGQSYLAKQKLAHFSDQLHNTDSIWKAFTNFYKTNAMIQLKSNPLLQDLLTETFH